MHPNVPSKFWLNQANRNYEHQQSEQIADFKSSGKIGPYKILYPKDHGLVTLLLNSVLLKRLASRRVVNLDDVNKVCTMQKSKTE